MQKKNIPQPKLSIATDINIHLLYLLLPSAFPDYDVQKLRLDRLDAPVPTCFFT